MSHTARESLPPDTATSTRSSGSSMSNSAIVRRTCSVQKFTKCSVQKFAFARRTSTTAGPRQTRHFTTRRPR